MRLVRLLQQPVEEHPFFLAAKYERPKDRRPTYRAAIHAGPVPQTVAPAQPIEVTVTVENRGRTTWPATSDSGSGHVRLGIQLLDADGRVTARDFARADLTADVPPGGSHVLRATFAAPDTPATYHLKFDMVAEGVTWFEPTGSVVEIRTLTVSRELDASVSRTTVSGSRGCTSSLQRSGGRPTGSPRSRAVPGRRCRRPLSRSRRRSL